MKHILLLILTCSFLFSCEQDYYVDNVAFTPKLVVNSVFTVGSKIEATVKSTRNVLDPESFIEEISDAKVVLKDDTGDVLSKLDFIGDGKYASDDVNLIVGTSYTLEVIREGYAPSIATSKIPTKVDASIQNRNIITTGVSESLNVAVKLRDNDIEDNYYVYEVVDDNRLLITEQSFSELIEDVQILLTTDAENQDQIAANSLLQSRVFLKDVNFANSEYEFNLKAKGNPAAIDGPVELTSDELFREQKLRVITASHSMYEYYKSIESYRIKGAANSSVSQPVAVYSNFSNGLGIFAGYNASEEDLLR